MAGHGVRFCHSGFNMRPCVRATPVYQARLCPKVRRLAIWLVTLRIGCPTLPTMQPYLSGSRGLRPLAPDGFRQRTSLAVSNVVMLLQVDHSNITRLLDLIRQQAANMARHGPVNYPLLKSIFAYLLSYPDQCHHPKEDLLYRKLKIRHPEMTDSLNDLVGEHEKLAHSTTDLVRAIDESQFDPPTPNERLADQLMSYLDAYRRHMLMEDLHFFPAALQLLCRDDFEEIDFTLFDKPDPLFDVECEERYAELRNEIAGQAAVEYTSGEQRDEAALLATFWSMAAFNDAMHRSGEPVLLTRSSAEGYELAHKGKFLMQIPACSESRAAWCAYFYWKATAREKRLLDLTGSLWPHAGDPASPAE